MNSYNGTLIGSSSFVTGYIDRAKQISINSYIKLPYIDFYPQSCHSPYITGQAYAGAIDEIRAI